MPSEWIGLLREIQQGGKSVQLLYAPGHGGGADLLREIDILCRHLDPTRLFICAVLGNVEQAEAAVSYARQVCLKTP